MKNLICLVLILFSSSSFAASGSGNVSSVLSLGGFSTASNLNIPDSNSQGYFMLYSNGGATISANTYQPLYKNGVAYQVTAGKTFKAIKVCIGVNTQSLVQLVSATASIAPNAGSLTGGVYQSGTAAGFHYSSGAAALYVPICWDGTYEFAASTYAGWFGSGANQYYIEVLGKEI